MNVTRITGFLALAASFALSACGGGGAPTTQTPSQGTTSQADAYTGPAAATADVTAFQVNFWNNVRSQNRCGQCHNATTPAQMPNFARSDDVNLAYAQANTVVSLATPSTSLVVTKVSGGHNCWLADNSACGQILTTWIQNWAGATGAGSATQVTLQAPADQTVGQSLNFPADATDYQTTVYTLTGNGVGGTGAKYCVRCHSSTADPSVQQSPYFADPTLTTAYPAAIPKIDFTGCQGAGGNNGGTCGTNSRFYQRLLTDNHNCWDNCAQDAALMLAQIQAFAAKLTPSSIDPSLVVSKAIGLAQGTIASGASRYDADTIAKYEFQSVVNNQTFDTSGVDPAADLTITGNVTLAGGWGINVGAGGKAQATTSASAKIYNTIQATGEFSVEAWVAPALVAVDNSYMVSYSGGDTTRNFTLGQTNQDYDFMLRSSGTGLNGTPQLQTPNAAMALQASLQHVVLTYDSVNGRQIYVNGVSVGPADPQKGGTISNWDSTFALVLGNEVSSDRSWQGLIKFVAIHSRALTASQVMQNYNAGVGERYYMLFNVSDVTAVNQSYVMFTVSQYDSFSYLFYQPTFISLDSAATITAPIPVQGFAHRLERRCAAGGPGLHPAEHQRDRGQLHAARPGAVERRYHHRAAKRSADRPVLPDLRRTRQPLACGGRSDADRAAALAGPCGGRHRHPHLRAGQLDAVGADRHTDHANRRERHLSCCAAAAAGHADVGRLLLRESSRYRAAGHSILQHHGEYTCGGRHGIAGCNNQRRAVLQPGWH